jgi:tetratricopeptide (TPR) repeat protein
MARRFASRREETLHVQKRKLMAPLLALALAMPVGAILVTAWPTAAEAQQTAGGWRKEVADKAKAAQEAGQKGDFKGAISLLKEAKAKAPLSPQEEQGVNELMIWAASGARDYGLLAATIEERLATGRVKGKDQIAKLDTLAKTYYTQRNYAKTVDATQRLIQARGSATADDLVMMGQSQFLLKNYSAAAKTLEQAYPATRKAGKPLKTQVQVLETMNAAYFELKDEKNRIETLHQLMLIQPKVSVFEQLVSQYQKERLDSVAMLNLFRLGDRKGVLAKDHYAKYAEAALDLASPGEAVKALEKGMAVGGIPKDDRNNRLVADAKSQLEAVKANIGQQEREAKAIADGDPDARLATSYFTLGDKGKAVEAARRAVEKGKLNREDDVQFLLGVALYDQKKTQEAATAFAAAAKANPANSDIANLWDDIAGG